MAKRLKKSELRKKNKKVFKKCKGDLTQYEKCKGAAQPKMTGFAQFGLYKDSEQKFNNINTKMHERKAQCVRLAEEMERVLDTQHKSASELNIDDDAHVESTSNVLSTVTAECILLGQDIASIARQCDETSFRTDVVENMIELNALLDNIPEKLYSILLSDEMLTLIIKRILCHLATNPKVSECTVPPLFKEEEEEEEEEEDHDKKEEKAADNELIEVDENDNLNTRLKDMVVAFVEAQKLDRLKKETVVKYLDIMLFDYYVDIFGATKLLINNLESSIDDMTLCLEDEDDDMCLEDDAKKWIQLQLKEEFKQEKWVFDELFGIRSNIDPDILIKSDILESCINAKLQNSQK
eukprot:24822_1